VAGLEWLVDMKVKHVEAYGDSQLVVQQVCGESQCLKGAVFAREANNIGGPRSSQSIEWEVFEEILP
jgi:ribonuclease HI